MPATRDHHRARLSHPDGDLRRPRKPILCASTARYTRPPSRGSAGMRLNPPMIALACTKRAPVSGGIIPSGSVSERHADERQFASGPPGDFRFDRRVDLEQFLDPGHPAEWEELDFGDRQAGTAWRRRRGRARGGRRRRRAMPASASNPAVAKKARRMRKYTLRMTRTPKRRRIVT